MTRQTLAVAAVAAMLFTVSCATTTTTDAADAAVPGALPPADIAGIMTAANEGEVQQGQAASTRATSADVRSFAQMMVTDHTTALDNARDVFNRNGITPGDNDITRTLRTNSQRTVTNLATHTGASYDREYMRTQVALHQWLLNALDTALIPSATGELRTLLQTQRGSVAAHLERARQISSGL